MIHVILLHICKIEPLAGPQSSKRSAEYYEKKDCVNENDHDKSSERINSIYDRPIGLVVECSPMPQETGVQSQSYQTQNVVLDTSLLNTQHYEVHFKGKVE